MSARDELVRAARELIVERGYPTVSVQDIMERSGAGRGSMYYSFPNKDALVAEALAAEALAARASISAILAQGTTALDRIGAYLAFERLSCHHGDGFSRIAADVAAEPSPLATQVVADMAAWIRDCLAAVVVEGVDRAELPPVIEPREIAGAVQSMVCGAQVLARLTSEPAAIDHVFDGIEAMLSLIRAGDDRSALGADH